MGGCSVPPPTWCLNSNCVVPRKALVAAAAREVLGHPYAAGWPDSCLTTNTERRQCSSCGRHRHVHGGAPRVSASSVLAAKGRRGLRATPSCRSRRSRSRSSRTGWTRPTRSWSRTGSSSDKGCSQVHRTTEEVGADPWLSPLVLGRGAFPRCIARLKSLCRSLKVVPAPVDAVSSLR